MSFFYYCFYRISSFYAAFSNKGNHIFGMAIVSLCQSFILLSLIAIPFIILNKEYSVWFVAVVMSIIYDINWFFVLTRKKYIILSKRWKNENYKYKKLKGWLILLYVITCIVAYMVVLSFMFKDKV